MINLYEDEINSKELEIYNVKLIQSLIQMDEKFKKVLKRYWHILKSVIQYSCQGDRKTIPRKLSESGK